jgi:hypothetical protein
MRKGPPVLAFDLLFRRGFEPARWPQQALAQAYEQLVPGLRPVPGPAQRAARTSRSPRPEESLWSTPCQGVCG